MMTMKRLEKKERKIKGLVKNEIIICERKEIDFYVTIEGGTLKEILLT